MLVYITMEERTYKAFISYRHLPLSKKVAKKIHSSVEHYRIPKELRKEGKDERPGRVFRDEEELPVSDDLTGEITYALDHSEFLIVVCEPGTKDSIWVDREIRYFISTHDREHVIAVLAEGKPEDSFPELLTTIYDEAGNVIGHVEPLAANLTGTDHKYSASRFGRESFRIYSALLQVPFDSLWQREKRYQLRRTMVLAAVLFALIFAFAANMWVNYRAIVKRNEQIEQQKAELTEQNAQIIAQNASIEQYNRSLELREGQLLLAEGNRLAENGDMRGAIADALAGYREDGSLDGETTRLLTRALGSGEYLNTFRTDVVVNLPAEAKDCFVTSDGSTVLVEDAAGYIRAFSAKTGDELWKHRFENSPIKYLMLDDRGLFVYEDSYSVIALELSDGSVAWDLKTTFGNDYSLYMNMPVLERLDGGKRILCPGYDAANERLLALYVDSLTGSVVNETVLDDAQYGGYGGEFTLGTALPDINTAVLCFESSIFVDAMSEGDYHLIVCDMAEGTVSLNKLLHFDKLLCGVYGELTAKIYLCYIKDGGIYWQGFSLDGEEDEPMLLDHPMREPFYTTRADVRIEADSRLICLTLDNEFIVFNGTDGSYIMTKTIDGSEIMGWCFLNYEDYGYLLYGEGGTYWANYSTNGRQEGYDFCDRKGIGMLALTKDFASNNADFGFHLEDGAVAAAVLSSDPRTVCIMHPCMDKSLTAVDWAAREQGYIEQVMTEGPDGQLVYVNRVSVAETGLMTVDPSTGTVLKRFEPGAGDPAGLDMSDEVYLWSDGSHVTLVDFGLSSVTVDLDSGNSETEFKDCLRCAIGRYTDGEVVRVAEMFSKTGANGLVSPINIMVDGSAEKQLTEIPTEWFLRDSMAVLSSHNILFGLTDPDSGETVYRIVNTDSGEETDIPTAAGIPENAAPITGGARDSRGLFAFRENDGIVRVYDPVAKKLLSEIDVKREDVAAMTMDSSGRYLIVVSMENRVMIFSTDSGEILLSVHAEFKGNMSDYMKMQADTAKDDEDRLYICFTGKGLMCFDMAEKSEVFSTGDAIFYCRETDEIYKTLPFALDAGSGVTNVVSFTIPTLEDLRDRGSEYLKK